MKSTRIAGRLKDQVIIQRQTQTKTPAGGTSNQWTAVHAVRAEYLPGAGNEKFTPSGVYAEAQARFRIRYGIDVLTTDKLSFESVQYDILSVTPIKHRTLVEIHVKGPAT